MNFALEPVNLPSFVAVRRLQNVASTARARLFESSQPGAGAMFAPLNTAADDVIKTQRPAAGIGGAGGATAPITAPAEPVLSPEERARREQAKLLVELTMFDIEDCVIALRKNGDSVERAAEWLFDSDAPRLLKAERDAKVAAKSKGKADGGGGGGNGEKSASVEKDTARMAQARELSSIYGMPVDISFHALQLFGENPDRAMGWLMDEGGEWVRLMSDASWKAQERAADVKAEALALEREKQSDAAALDDVGRECTVCC